MIWLPHSLFYQYCLVLLWLHLIEAIYSVIQLHNFFGGSSYLIKACLGNLKWKPRHTGHSVTGKWTITILIYLFHRSLIHPECCFTWKGMDLPWQIKNSKTDNVPKECCHQSSQVPNWTVCWRAGSCPWLPSSCCCQHQHYGLCWSWRYTTTKLHLHDRASG